MVRKIPADLVLLLLITLASLSIYSINLSNLPSIVHGDEGETALSAIEIMKNPTHLIGIGWFDLPLLSFVPHAIGMWIFGQNILGNRMGSAIFGAMTIPFFYLFLRKLFNKTISVTATILLATSHMWIALSRVGITYLQATFFIILTFYFLFSGIKNNKKIYFILTGISLGLSMYSYYAVRVLPLLILPPLISYFLEKRKLRDKLLNFFLLISFAIIIFLPQGLFFLSNPESFSSRTNMVYIFSPIAKQWTNYNKDNSGILLEQTGRTLNIFAGDNSTQYGYKGQLIDYLSLFFFGLGLLSAFKLKTNLKLFLYLWLFFSVLGQILTSIPPPIFLPRFVIGLPILYIFITLGIFEFLKLMSFLRLKKIVGKILFFCLIFILIFTNIWTYFFRYPKTFISDSGSILSTKISNYINKLDRNSVVYFYTEPYLYENYGTLRFLTPNVEKISMGVPGNNGDIEMPSSNHNGRNIFIIHPQYFFVLNKLVKIFPKGEIKNFNNTNVVQFYSLEVN